MFGGKQKQHEVKLHNPCGERWDNMPHHEQGRFCENCKTAVIDFTGMSDEEVLLTFQKMGGHACGRFLPTQIDRGLQLPVATLQIPKPTLLQKLAASVLLFFSFVGQSQAGDNENKPRQQQTVALRPATPQLQTDYPDDNRTIAITGKVLDYHSASPIAGIRIVVKDYPYTGVSDSNGNFTISIPIGCYGHTLTIQAIYAGTGDRAHIQPVQVKIETQPMAQELILYRYPVGDLPATGTDNSKVSERLSHVCGGAFTVVTYRISSTRPVWPSDVLRAFYNKRPRW